MALVIKRPLSRLMVVTNRNHALKKNSNKLFAPSKPSRTDALGSDSVYYNKNTKTQVNAPR